MKPCFSNGIGGFFPVKFHWVFDVFQSELEKNLLEKILQYVYERELCQLKMQRFCYKMGTYYI